MFIWKVVVTVALVKTALGAFSTFFTFIGIPMFFEAGSRAFFDDTHRKSKKATFAIW